jgi:hypothetical protein
MSFRGCRSIFVISILYGIRTGILEMIEGFLYEDLDGKIRDSILHEQLMIYVERSHLETNSSIRWNPQVWCTEGLISGVHSVDIYASYVSY